MNRRRSDGKSDTCTYHHARINSQQKSSVEQLVGNHSNILIRAAKVVDAGVTGVETLERWQRLKVHRMSLVRYLGEEKIKLFCQKIESSTGIQLKTVPRWLISES